MPEFEYQARNASGAKVDGRLYAFDRQEALRTLVSQSLAPLKLKESRASKKVKRSVPKSALVGFYVRLADLLSAGVPLLRALKTLSRKQKSPALAAALSDVQSKVSEGQQLADAFQANGSIFGELPINVVRAGEEGGFLEESLRRVARFIDQTEGLKRKVIGALAYPAFLVIVGTLILVGMMIFFVPRFAPIFERLKQVGELPAPTKFLLGISGQLRENSLIIGVSAAIVAVVLVNLFRKETGRRLFENLCSKLFIVGPLTQQIVVSRFCRIFGILLSNDVPIQRSLQITENATGSVLVRDAIRQAINNVTEGKRLSDPLEASGQFPDEIIEVISVGEDANNLAEVLLAASDSLDRRVEQDLELFVRLIEPCLLLVMAGIILFFLVALLLPVFQTSQLLG